MDLSDPTIRQLAEQVAASMGATLVDEEPPKKYARPRRNPKGGRPSKIQRARKLAGIPVAFRIPPAELAILRVKAHEIAEERGLTRPCIGHAVALAIHEAGWARQYRIEIA